MKFYVTLLGLILSVNVVCASAKIDSLFAVLRTEMGKKKEYDRHKEQRIEKLRQQLNEASARSNAAAQYNICSTLYEEYKSYQFDSAYVYTQKLLAASNALNDVNRKNKSNIRLAFILLSSGMFKETFDCLNHINLSSLNADMKHEYYSICARAYSDLADYDGDKNYSKINFAASIKCLDSAIAFSKPRSFEMMMDMGDKSLHQNNSVQAAACYSQLLNKYPLTEHQKAMVSTGLSFSYSNQPAYHDERIILLATAAIDDIRSSTKETLAIFKLGEQLYHDGDIVNAYTFIEHAMGDAQYYGTRLRKLKISAVLPIVAAKKLIIIENDKKKFLFYFLLITAVAVVVVLISFITFNQLKRLKVKERIIEQKNLQLEKINERLTEDTRIKEEYIGSFFTMMSGYILTIEKLKRNIERKIAVKKFDEIGTVINEINIKKERESLFHTFDHIFLRIFPNFINAFNSLLKSEHQIWPKSHEVLNTDLRIFALMRLGINDNQAIANILEYSVNTIYVYKMRIKAKALVPGEQFDHRIMAIRATDVPAKAYELQE